MSKMESKLEDTQILSIRLAAEQARIHAYAPYSKFRVGSAVMDAEGMIHPGCNVENAAYGSTICAERTALTAAIAQGVRSGDFRGLAVIADTPEPITPCGACRQVIVELCPGDMPVWFGNIRGTWREVKVRDLLPGAFTKEVLKGEGF